MEADVVKLVDTLVLGTSALSREGSSPFIRTTKIPTYAGWDFLFLTELSLLFSELSEDVVGHQLHKRHNNQKA